MLPYKLDTTNDLLTSRAGLITIGQLLESLNLSERIDQHFSLPKSNRGYLPSLFIQTLLLMQHEGSFHLDDIRHLQEDEALREQIASMSESDWQPLLNRQGDPIEGEETCRTVFCIGDYEKTFTLIVQRRAIQGQTELELVSEDKVDEVSIGGYAYRAIATNRDQLNDSEIVHWYNQRAEDSENRIKELKLDLGGDTLPCSDFSANALYFLITALSFNLFALMRALLPETLSRSRIVTIRWRLYGMAAKVVKTGRQLFVKLKAQHRALLETVLLALREFEAPPI